MPTITEVGNPSNSYSFPDFDSWDEFIPYVALDSVTFPESDATVKEKDKYKLFPDENDRVTLSEHIDKGFQNHGVEVLTTREQKIKLTFSVTKASEDSYDPDGVIGVILSINDPTIQITSPEKMPITTQYQKTITIELEMTSEERKEFYIDFYANDNDDFFEGEYKDVYCGRIKIVFEVPNIWEFSNEQIEQIKQYANENYERQEDYTLGDRNRYHHCTDTHKHIVLRLLGNPEGLDLGKDQDHEANRLTPRDFEKAGESTTKGVRDILMAQGYSESSKIFTVLDIDNNEVVKNGKPYNTKEDLSGFKESPIEYLKSKCPSSGNYMFIGAYNADYHSFTIVVTKVKDNFEFFFIDQMVGVENHEAYSLEYQRFLDDIFNYSYDYPLQLEVYQLRNKKQ